MLRPARVLIRSRKPWVFARRRVLGWNVRFMILLDVTSTLLPELLAPEGYAMALLGSNPTPKTKLITGKSTHNFHFRLSKRFRWL
jgi:hypothetical protein